MRYALLLVMALLLAVAPATAEDVYITLIGPENKPVANAKITLIGAETYTNTTDSNGIAYFNVPNGTYAVWVDAGAFAVATILEVAGPTNATINVTTMHIANITSTPISVTVGISYSLVTASVDVATNLTLYGDIAINVTYPDEVVRFPYRYLLESLTVNGNTTAGNTVTLDLTATDYTVVGKYTQQFYVQLGQFELIVLVLVVVAGLAIAWIASARAAKAVISELRRRRRFVKEA